MLWHTISSWQMLRLLLVWKISSHVQRHQDNIRLRFRHIDLLDFNSCIVSEMSVYYVSIIHHWQRMKINKICESGIWELCARKVCSIVCTNLCAQTTVYYQFVSCVCVSCNERQQSLSHQHSTLTSIKISTREKCRIQLSTFGGDQLHTAEVGNPYHQKKHFWPSLHITAMLRACLFCFSLFASFSSRSSSPNLLIQCKTLHFPLKLFLFWVGVHNKQWEALWTHLFVYIHARSSKT